MKRKAVFFVVIGCMLMSCSGRMNASVRKLDKLLLTAETAIKDLETIDTLVVKELAESSAEVVQRFRESVKDDTLSLEFAQHLDVFLAAGAVLKDLNNEKKQCWHCAVAAKDRCKRLQDDIRSGAGDRSGYDRYVRRETLEINAIRNYSKKLKRRFEESKTAIAQFQPEIERFISRFAEPVTVP